MISLKNLHANPGRLPDVPLSDIPGTPGGRQTVPLAPLNPSTERQPTAAPQRALAAFPSAFSPGPAAPRPPTFHPLIGSPLGERSSEHQRHWAAYQHRHDPIGGSTRHRAIHDFLDAVRARIARERQTPPAPGGNHNPGVVPPQKPPDSQGGHGTDSPSPNPEVPEWLGGVVSNLINLQKAMLQLQQAMTLARVLRTMSSPDQDSPFNNLGHSTARIVKVLNKVIRETLDNCLKDAGGAQDARELLQYLEPSPGAGELPALRDPFAQAFVGLPPGRATPVDALGARTAV